MDLIENWRENGDTIVFTNGVFDLLHRGHLAIFEQASRLGDILIVGVNSDSSARRLAKGPGRPLCSEVARAEMIAGFETVDVVTLFDEDTPYELLSMLKPDVLVKGSDYNIENIIGAEFAKRVERIDLVPGLSTTSLIKKIQRIESIEKNPDEDSIV